MKLLFTSVALSYTNVVISISLTNVVRAWFRCSLKYQLALSNASHNHLEKHHFYHQNIFLPNKQQHIIEHYHHLDI